MFRRPPRSTLFPTRRSSDLDADERDCAFTRRSGDRCDGLARNYRLRSEEHTSELQSHVNLVCHLLLEKKKHRTIPLRPGSADIPQQEQQLLITLQIPDTYIS